jgi:hypothetical protein
MNVHCDFHELTAYCDDNSQNVFRDWLGHNVYWSGYKVRPADPSTPKRCRFGCLLIGPSLKEVDEDAGNDRRMNDSSTGKGSRSYGNAHASERHLNCGHESSLRSAKELQQPNVDNGHDLDNVCDDYDLPPEIGNHSSYRDDSGGSDIAGGHSVASVASDSAVVGHDASLPYSDRHL